MLKRLVERHPKTYESYHTEIKKRSNYLRHRTLRVLIRWHPKKDRT